jgi:hypothetical protein
LVVITVVEGFVGVEVLEAVAVLIDVRVSISTTTARIEPLGGSLAVFSVHGSLVTGRRVSWISFHSAIDWVFPALNPIGIPV